MSRQGAGRRRNARRAFTLIEIIVVVTIIALLAVVIAPRLWGRIGQAQVSKARTEVKAIATAVELYVNDTGQPPTDDFDLDLLRVPAEEGGGPMGPYVKKTDDLVDPWGNLYVLRAPGIANYDFDIVSWGPDGQEGTEDDITN